MCYCVRWRRALLKLDQKHADLNGCKLLLTHNIIKHEGNICNFMEMHALVLLEQRYCKLKDWTTKFLLVFG